jgi:carboxymethylenebutenolidase
MDQRVINLYDRFTHGGISRRQFLDRLADLTGSAAAAAAVLPLLQNNPAKAESSRPTIRGLRSRPSTTTPAAQK